MATQEQRERVTYLADLIDRANRLVGARTYNCVVHGLDTDSPYVTLGYYDDAIKITMKEVSRRRSSLAAPNGSVVKFPGWEFEQFESKKTFIRDEEVAEYIAMYFIRRNLKTFLEDEGRARDEDLLKKSAALLNRSVL